MRRLGAGADGNAVISAGLAISGDLDCTEEVVVNGTVIGDIRSPTVLIGESGMVDGTITADAVSVLGVAKGRIEAVEVAIGRTAKVYATVFHHQLTVEPGAIVQGRQPWRPRDHMEQRITASRYPITLAEI